VWSPHTKGDNKLFQSLQNRAARWICGSHWSSPTNSWTISSSDCSSQPNLPTIESRRQYLSVSYLHDIYHQHTSIMFNCYCKLNSISSTRSHHLSQSTINSRHYSFFVNTVFLCTYVLINIFVSLCNLVCLL